MAIAKWAPFSAFTSLEQEMHSLLDRLGARPWLEGFGWKPDTDIYRRGGILVVEAELPGLDPSRDLTVDVDDGVVFIAYRFGAERIGRVRAVIDEARRIVPGILADQQAGGDREDASVARQPSDQIGRSG